MIDFELQTLIFKENDSTRVFLSNDFNFILDKERNFSICYGSSSDETPTYDPLSPQEIEIFLNENFLLKDNYKNFDRLFNIEEKDEDFKIISISTISNVVITIPDIYMRNINEVIGLIKYLKCFGFNISLKVNYEQVKTIGDVFRLKTFEHENFVFDVHDFNVDELLNSLKLILSKNLNVSYNFFINSNNYMNLCSLMNSDFPNNTFSTVTFKNPISKDIKETVADAIKNNGTFTICDTKTIKNSKLNFPLIKKYQDGLFKCYIDFDKEMVSFAPGKKGIGFGRIKNIDSYWNSDLFKKNRESLVKNKYESVQKGK